MIYLESPSNDPSYNIAFEEYAFSHIADKDNVFILWINSPCIVVGKNQNTVQEINQKYCDEKGIKIVRRISGGGAVYHDLNNLNYTIISNEESNAKFDFKSLSMPVIETLAEMGIKAEFTGRNDLVIDDQKFCGNAQHIKGNRVMHHGCILFDVDLNVLSNALKVSKDKIESKGKKSVISRVTNIKSHLENKNLTTNNFKNLLRNYMDKHYNMTEYKLNEEEEKGVLEMKAKRNDSWDWVYGKNPEFTIQRNRRLPSGKVEANILVKENIIENIKFYGDFFGVKDVNELGEKLKGVKYERESIKNAIKDIDTTEYFMGVEIDDVLDILVD
ncbi:MAG: lipoate--protein ligase [Clostridiales bacterium]|nr:MAG: lipoate--protein ligase [Clostridiales bacterium]